MRADAADKLYPASTSPNAVLRVANTANEISDIIKIKDRREYIAVRRFINLMSTLTFSKRRSSYPTPILLIFGIFFCFVTVVMSEKEIKKFTGNFSLIASFLETAHEETKDPSFYEFSNSLKTLPIRDEGTDKLFDEINKKIEEHNLLKNEKCMKALCAKMKLISKYPPNIKHINKRCHDLSEEILKSSRSCTNLKQTLEVIDSECDFLNEIPIPIIPILSSVIAVFVVALVHLIMIHK